MPQRGPRRSGLRRRRTAWGTRWPACGPLRPLTGETGSLAALGTRSNAAHGLVNGQALHSPGAQLVQPPAAEDSKGGSDPGGRSSGAPAGVSPAGCQAERAPRPPGARRRRATRGRASAGSSVHAVSGAPTHRPCLAGLPDQDDRGSEPRSARTEQLFLGPRGGEGWNAGVKALAAAVRFI